jgi:hypothetical protein
VILRLEDVKGTPTLRIDTEIPGQRTDRAALFWSVTTWEETVFGEVRSHNVWLGMTMDELRTVRTVIDGIIETKGQSNGRAG